MTRISILAIIVLMLTACSSEPTLQKYFVEKTESTDFIAIDVSPEILNLDKQKLSAEEAAAVESFDKINILAFPLNETNKPKYDAERATVDQLLKDEKYQELMRFGSGKDGASISFVGDEDNIDEFVVYAKSKENGLVVVRVLGDNMNPNSIMTMMSLLQSSEANLDQLKPLQQMFNKNL